MGKEFVSKKIKRNPFNLSQEKVAKANLKNNSLNENIVKRSLSNEKQIKLNPEESKDLEIRIKRPKSISKILEKSDEFPFSCENKLVPSKENSFDKFSLINDLSIKSKCKIEKIEEISKLKQYSEFKNS